MVAAPETTRRTLQHPDNIMHVCEGETSMIMAVAPELVHHDQLPDAHGAALGLTTELTGLIYTLRSFTDLTTSGVAGDARTASAGKAGRAACRPGCPAGSSNASRSPAP